jgi:hypothetical protein
MGETKNGRLGVSFDSEQRRASAIDRRDGVRSRRRKTIGRWHSARLEPCPGSWNAFQDQQTAEKLLAGGHFERTISCLKADCPLEDGQVE